MVDETVEIVQNRKINGAYYKLAFRSRRLSAGVRPGQFVSVRVHAGNDPFLRRPFSYYRVVKDRVEILYEILGRGTAALARKSAGDVLQVMGPLGKPFRQKIGAKKRVLVAGGIGVPPLVFLAERCPCAYLLIGAGSKEELLPAGELSKVRAEMLLSTDDGSRGKKGLVTALLEELIAREDPGKLYIQTCGPGRMMRAVMDIARRHGIQGEASMDKEMACGVGACLGCMVKTEAGWATACKEGPVFDFAALDAGKE